VRLDKFLQVSGLVRRRALAAEVCAAGRVQRNGRAARASAPVAPGDVLRIDYGWRVLTVRVDAVPERPTPPGERGALYTVLEDARSRGDEPG
jgi:ribosomal 50S subunit-recycling heat shock protein